LNPPESGSYRDGEERLDRELLRERGIATSGAPLVTALASPDVIVKLAAAHLIGIAGDSTAIPALAALLEDPIDLVQTEAAYALLRLDDPRGRPVLARWTHERVDAFIAPAIAAGYLARAGDPSGLPTVRRSFDVDNVAVRISACKRISDFLPYPEAEHDVDELFERALADPEPDVVWQALLQLREIRTAAATALLERAAHELRDTTSRELAVRFVDERRAR